MVEFRRAQERGFADHGWLRSYHSFSFADYYDPLHVKFGALRVFNEDRVAPGHGFGMHAHDNMEIVSYVLDGCLEHKDTMGNGSLMEPGDVQCMSAGTGVRHSEMNASVNHGLHFLQIWIEPWERGLAPSYEQKRFEAAAKRGRLCLIASPDGHDDSLAIHQDVRIYAGLFDGVERATYGLEPDRRAYVHIVRGTVSINRESLVLGDAAKLKNIPEIAFGHGHEAEVLLFDLASAD